MSDYRDDRGALRSRNAELEQQLADRERELAELKSRNEAAPEPKLSPPTFPVKRDVDPRVLMEMRGSEVPPISTRMYVICGLGLLIALLVAAMYSDRVRTLVHPGGLLLAVLVSFALLLLAVGWPKKE